MQLHRSKRIWRKKSKSAVTASTGIPCSCSENLILREHLLLSSLSLVLSWTFHTGAAVHYVDVNSPSPTPPHTNWATAAVTIQDGVDVSTNGDSVLVTNGVYQTGGVVVGGLSNRLAVTKAVTVQSVNGPALTTIQGYQVPGATNGPNAVRCVYLTNNASLIGFTLTNGATYYPWNPSGFQSKAAGGGVFCESGSTLVSNCIIIGNSASAEGGGVHGGTLNNCEIVGNVSGFGGGGASESTLNNCWAINNHAEVSGGGLDSCNANNCLICSNAAGAGGSPFSAGGGASSNFRNILNNCTLVGNSAKLGGGAFNGTLNNCIVYYNNGGNYASYVSNFPLINLNYCCTVPLPSGSGNITNEPLFIDLAAGNLRLQPNSPCINTGNNIYAPAGPDLDGNARIVGGRVDVGAFERPLSVPIVGCTPTAKGECGVPVQVTANVSDPDSEALTVFWSVNGQTVQTNGVPASSSVEGTNVSIIAQFPLGTNEVEVLVSDDAANIASCSTTVTVIDTTTPVILAAYAQPSVLWPPNHRMVPVTVRVDVTDNCGPAEWTITGVQSNESINGSDDGKSGADWVITSDHTVSLRAKRMGAGAGRIYAIIVQAKDPSGNVSELKALQVTVPKSQRK